VNLSRHRTPARTPASALARDENDDGCAFETDERKPRSVQQIRHLHRNDAAMANPTKTLVPNDGLKVRSLDSSDRLVFRKTNYHRDAGRGRVGARRLRAEQPAGQDEYAESERGRRDRNEKNDPARHSPGRYKTRPELRDSSQFRWMSGSALLVCATQILRAISKAVALGSEGSGREWPVGTNPQAS
jgi:hypothetical protein